MRGDRVRRRVENDHAASWGNRLKKFECGPASAAFEMADDGTLRGSLNGLLVPANAGAISALVLAAGTEAGARGVLCSVEQALVALPPLGAKHYNYVPLKLRAIPVALLVSAEQAVVYEGIAQAAAASGIMRRAFLWRDEAEAWLQEQTRALAANQVWWSGRRSLP